MDTSQGNGFGFEDNFDPYSTGNQGNGVKLPQPIIERRKSDEQYLVALESKLKRYKVAENSPCPKEMIRLLQKAKEGTVEQLVVSSQDLIIDDGINEAEMHSSSVKRRMFPEQAMTMEEVQCLVEKDYLNQYSQDLKSVAEKRKMLQRSKSCVN